MTLYNFVYSIFDCMACRTFSDDIELIYDCEDDTMEEYKLWFCQYFMLR
jgi:hypothetical protein